MTSIYSMNAAQLREHIQRFMRGRNLYQLSHDEFEGQYIPMKERLRQLTEPDLEYQHKHRDVVQAVNQECELPYYIRAGIASCAVCDKHNIHQGFLYTGLDIVTCMECGREREDHKQSKKIQFKALE